MNTLRTGNYIREKRMELGLTQEGLAERVGVSSKTISNWETGKSEIKQENAKKLAEELGVSPTSIFMGEDTDKLDEATKTILEHIIEDLYSIEDRGLLALEIGVMSFGLALVALAMAWWSVSTKTVPFVLLCGFLALFGIWFLVGGKIVVRRLEHRVRKRREQSGR